MSNPPSYLLVGRGGGSMSVAVGFSRSADGAWGISATFTRAAQAGSSGALRPGECAWMDRPVSAQEPNVLALGSNGAWHLQGFTVDAGTRKLADARFYGNRDADAEAPRRFFQWVTTAGHLFYVHCFHPPWSPSLLLITKLGP